MRRSLRVLLISANTEKIPDPVFPLGAAYMAAVARRSGHSVTTLDLCFLDSLQPGLDDALATQPDVVGISLRNLDSSAFPQNTSYIDDYKNLMLALRQRTAAPIVLGGAGFTVMPSTILEYLGAEVGVVGEGEMIFPWILERLAARESLTTTPAFRCDPVGSGILVSATSRVAQLDLTGTPLRESFDMDVYYERGGALNIQTKRGCYFECVFCSYPLIEGSKVRSRTAASVVDEIEAVRRERGIRHWFFVDNIFNMPIR
ncbi:MAG TPA: cobalamin-dependent protein, partial [Candidatus Acidoferrales bacterium]|nr:cobalamin-dependent protein [Candidatus Acidoferrales bacterium]